MKLAIWAVAFFLPISAHAQTVDDLRDRWEVCLTVASIKLGTDSCHAPSELMSAVYGQCTKHEGALEGAMRKKYSSPVAEGALEGFRERFNQKIPGWVIEAQSKHCK
jgi:hypothetical protein